ncbi:MAG TPA: hemerythrin domain-containing protein [Terriglobia bacterium]|nr:hemerythrin domain-containing protein [Terriglobia bacterium]
MRTTTILKDEHRYISRALDVIERMAARRENGESLDSREVGDILRFLRLFADNHHQGKEEMILFPALLKDRNQIHYTALAQFIFAHNQERSEIVGLENAIEESQDVTFVPYAKRLLEVLRAHIEEENHRLFELTDATLTPQEDMEVARELAGFERHWQDTVLTGLLARLSQIEDA